MRFLPRSRLLNSLFPIDQNLLHISFRTLQRLKVRFNTLELFLRKLVNAATGSASSVTSVQDLTAAVSGDSSKALTPELSWLPEVLSSENVPQKGATVGEKWKSEKPVPGALLAEGCL